MIYYLVIGLTITAYKDVRITTSLERGGSYLGVTAGHVDMVFLEKSVL